MFYSSLDDIVLFLVMIICVLNVIADLDKDAQCAKVVSECSSNETFENPVMCVNHNITDFVPKLLNVVKCSLVPMTFTVELIEPLRESEMIGIVGDVPQLGSWKLSHSIPLRPIKLRKKRNSKVEQHDEKFYFSSIREQNGNLTKTTANRRIKNLLLDSTDKPTSDLSRTCWTVIVPLCKGIVVYYRYFSYILDVHGKLQIRHWESYLDPRSIRVCKHRCNRIDKLGLMDNGEIYLDHGWLLEEIFVQFKIIVPHQIRFFNEEDINAYSQEVFVKFVPLNSKTGMPKDAGEASVEVVKMVYTQSILRPQGTYGVLCKPDDIIIFHARINFFPTTAYAIIFYSTEEEPIGFARIFPSDLAHSTGTLYVTIRSVDGLRKIALFIIPYLVIKPTTYSNEYDLRTSFGFTWLDIWKQLDIGHMGMGASFIINPAPFTENTIESLLAASELHLDGVSVDVQVTADCVPIVYDHFSFLTAIPGISEPQTEKDLMEIFIRDIKYEELKNWPVYFIINNKIVKYPSHYDEPVPAKRLFPKLEEVFKTLPINQGIVIDVRYPQELDYYGFESKEGIDKNIFVDSIIYVILFYGYRHPILLTSFNADITIMMRTKQNRIPVAFITNGTGSHYRDRRTHSVWDAINHCQAFGLIGIVLNARDILRQPSIVQTINDLGKEVYAWGSDINSPERLNYIKSLNPALVIYDRADLIGPKNKTMSILECKSSISLFHTQCIYP